ncbi:MAG TPA: hypothetical protein VGO68_06900 [Pyrinomonadaceae bacterium]|jgi:hypothetical protein|nr:hypothetical protein [Pyrinomonadaceae bacterium]
MSWSQPLAHSSLNHFNYFTEIEDAFIRRRAKHLLLSPMDWALIESWKEMQVPLHVALRGIEKAFDSWESKPRKRSIKGLLYCQEEVEAQFAEWREARVGAGDDSEGVSEPAKKEVMPFSQTAILEHLQRGRERLLEVCATRKKAKADDFTDTLERAAALLSAVEEDFAASAAPNAQKLEQSLSGLERMISDAICAVAGTEQIATIEGEVKEQLRPYRTHMEPAAYQTTFTNLKLKRLREQFGIPRLSLFYL